MGCRRLLGPLLLLGCCYCSGSDPKPVAPPADRGPTEGLIFPDRLAPGERGADQHAALDHRSAERPGEPRDATGDTARPPDLVPPDTRPPDTWPGGPCLYDWAAWTCKTSVWNFACTATCGAGLMQITCSMLGAGCSCKKGIVSKPCATPPGSSCTACQLAMKSGCCGF